MYSVCDHRDVPQGCFFAVCYSIGYRLGVDRRPTASASRVFSLTPCGLCVSRSIPPTTPETRERPLDARPMNRNENVKGAVVYKI